MFAGDPTIPLASVDDPLVPVLMRRAYICENTLAHSPESRLWSARASAAHIRLSWRAGVEVWEFVNRPRFEFDDQPADYDHMTKILLHETMRAVLARKRQAEDDLFAGGPEPWGEFALASMGDE